MTSITFFFILIPVLALILLAVNLIFAPHNPYQEKNGSFECGFTSFLGQNRTQFSISFFIFALLFLLFDLEILLVYPYLVSSYTNEAYGLFVLLLFLLALTLGFAFELGKKALTIDSRQMHKTTNNGALNTSIVKNNLLLTNNKRVKVIGQPKKWDYNKRSIIGTFIVTTTTTVATSVGAGIIASVVLYALFPTLANMFNNTSTLALRQMVQDLPGFRDLIDARYFLRSAFFDVVHFREIFQLPQRVESLSEDLVRPSLHLRWFVEQTSSIIRADMDRMINIVRDQEVFSAVQHYNFIVSHNIVLDALDNLLTSIQDGDHEGIAANLYQLQRNIYLFSGDLEGLLVHWAQSWWGDPLIGADSDEEFAMLVRDLFLP